MLLSALDFVQNISQEINFHIILVDILTVANHLILSFIFLENQDFFDNTASNMSLEQRANSFMPIYIGVF